jgi:hypothetical protein
MSTRSHEHQPRQEIHSLRALRKGRRKLSQLGLLALILGLGIVAILGALLIWWVLHS